MGKYKSYLCKPNDILLVQVLLQFNPSGDYEEKQAHHQPDENAVPQIFLL